MIDARQELSIIEGEFRAIATPSPPDAEKFAVLTSALNHKLTSLARQASELMNVKGVVCFAVELSAIANALDTSGDLSGAERLYREAVGKATSAFYRSINQGLLADHLMRHGDLSNGRLAYEQA